MRKGVHTRHGLSNSPQLLQQGGQALAQLQGREVSLQQAVDLPHLIRHQVHHPLAAQVTHQCSPGQDTSAERRHMR